MYYSCDICIELQDMALLEHIINIRVTKKMWHELSELANSDDRTTHGFIRHVLATEIKKQKRSAARAKSKAA